MERIWIRPELVVMRRGTPGEVILSNCKDPNTTGASSANLTCMKNDTEGVCCVCSAVDAS